MPTSYIILFSLIGGIVPALAWLMFWLQEDKLHPEPRQRIAFSFFAGMTAVAFVLPVQQFTEVMFGSIIVLTVILWAFIEELFKYLAARFTALGSKDMDEPIDAVIYLITAALGFAALENTLYIAALLVDGDILGSLIVGNVRFVGASLLHIICSATIGVFIALSFYRSKMMRRVYVGVGILSGTALHVAFNLFIMKDIGSVILFVYFAVWIAIIVLLLFLERIKQIGISKSSRSTE